MKQRCCNPNNSDYEHYGGRGISYPLEWDDFENFYADMGPRPEGHSIDRIDNNADYSKDNCRWAPQHQQTRNTRRTVIISVNGERMCLKDAAEMFDINYSTARTRYNKYAWDIVDVLELRGNKNYEVFVVQQGMYYGGM
jgi:hypothetical protein